VVIVKRAKPHEDSPFWLKIDGFADQLDDVGTRPDKLFELIG
jgi:hypothetical protein